ncbi:MAG: hypothetical protein V1662_02020 [Candidatus Omnitrophota bacterium]
MKKKKAVILFFCLLFFSVRVNTARSAQDLPVKYVLISAVELAPVDSILRESIKKLLPTAEETYLEYNSERAKKYIKELDIRFVPFVIFDKSITATDAFFHMVRNKMVDKVKGCYVIPEEQLRMGEVMLLQRKRAPDKLDVFVGGICPYAKQAQSFLRDFTREKDTDMDIRMRYLVEVHEFGISAQGGEEEIKEDLRQIVIQQYHPEKFREYLLLAQQEGPKEALDKVGISGSFIESKKEEALKIMKADFAEAQLLGITHSPTFLWENQYLIPTIEMLKPHLQQSVR